MPFKYWKSRVLHNYDHHLWLLNLSVVQLHPNHIFWRSYGYGNVYCTLSRLNSPATDDITLETIWLSIPAG